MSRPSETTAIIPVTIAQPAASIVAISEQAAAEISALLDTAAAITEVASGNLAAADETYATLHRTGKSLEAAREAAKRPVLEIGRAIDAAAKGAADRLDREKRRIGALITSWKQAEEARRDEAHRRALEEQARKEAEILAQVRAGVLSDLPPGEDDPVAVARAECAAIAAVPTPPPPEPVKTSVRTSTSYQVRIVQEELIPRQYLVPDTQRILADLRAGIAVPGCALDTIIGTAAKGR